MLIEERVSDDRWSDYGDSVATPLQPAAIDDLAQHHRAYLARAVRYPSWSTSTPRAACFPATATAFPATLAGSTMLLHVVAARNVGDPAVIVPLAQAALARGPGAAESREELDLRLEVWRDRAVRGRGAWPMFAAYLADHADTITEGDTTVDANTLRDRLGLWHLDPSRPPATGPFTVLCFAYRASEVRGGAGARHIAMPTVLDHDLYPAFFSSPTADVGRPVDFRAGGPAPSRELLHAPLSLAARHLYALGTIDSPPAVALASARRRHRDWWRAQGFTAFVREAMS